MGPSKVSSLQEALVRDVTNIMNTFDLLPAIA